MLDILKIKDEEELVLKKTVYQKYWKTYNRHYHRHNIINTHKTIKIGDGMITPNRRNPERNMKETDLKWY